MIQGKKRVNNGCMTKRKRTGILLSVLTKTAKNTKNTLMGTGVTRGLFRNSVCKPGSVLNGHLSLRRVAAPLAGMSPLPPGDICRAGDPHAVLLRIGFTADARYRANW